MPRRRAALVPSTWWAEDWLDAMARGSERSRTQRGRGYARGGRVEELVIQPGLIAARVQGTRPTPYRVEVRVPTFDEAIWRRAVQLLAEQATHLSSLLIGQLAAGTEQLLSTLGVSLFPRPDERVAIACSCPDWERPCKHALAVLQLVAARVKTDPLVLFALRGRGREDLLAALRVARWVAAADEPAPMELPTFEPEHFWEMLLVAEPEVGRDSLSALKRLPPPPPALGGALLRQELAAAYAILSERATTRAVGV